MLQNQGLSSVIKALLTLFLLIINVRLTNLLTLGIILAMYKFIKYTGNYTRGDTKIAINKSGLIRLSSGFCRLTNIKRFEYVVLYYDSVEKAIAFKFTNTQEDGAFKVTKDRTGATLSALSFLKTNKILLRSYFGRYEYKKQTVQNIGEVYIIDLNRNETNI